jgi:hypothetical protein
MMSTTIAPLALILSRRMGWTLESRVLRRRIKASKHILRLPEPSLCFDANVFEMLRPGFDRVEVSDRESGMTYEVTASIFDEHGVRCDLGHGLQLRLPLRLWSASRRENTQLAFALEAAP